MRSGKAENDSVAGIETVLQVYKDLQKRYEDYHVPELDKYLKLQEEGRLQWQVRLHEIIAQGGNGVSL